MNILRFLIKILHFFSDYYLYLNVWIDILKKSNLNTGIKKLNWFQNIGETHVVVESISVKYSGWWYRLSLYRNCLLLISLFNSNTFDPKTSSGAASLRYKLYDSRLFL